MVFTLEIDIRENVLKPHFDPSVFKVLDIADILIKKDDDVLLAVERKTIDDLKASIIDGRWKEQKSRLCSNIKKDRIIYLIEGNILKKTSMRGGSDTLIGATINCMLRDKIKVYKTSNVKETISFIKKIYSSIQKKYNDFYSSNTELPDHNEYVNSIKIKKKDNYNPKVWYKQILMSIPQVSSTTVEPIINKYTSLKELIDKATVEDMKILTYETKTGKKRKIGPKLSERIFEYINHIDE